MPRFPTIEEEPGWAPQMSAGELSKVKPMPEEKRKALVARMLGEGPSSPAAPSLPKRPKREDFETDEDFEEALGFYKHRMPRRYKASPAK
jgi:hypothetical protein